MSNDNCINLDPNQPVLFPELTRKIVTANFDGGHVSSDGGCLLLARLDHSYGYVQRFSACFHDYRDPELIASACCWNNRKHLVSRSI